MSIKKPLHRDSAENSLSFHERRSEMSVGTGKLRRPKTVPNFASVSVFPSTDLEKKPKTLTKLLLNVAIQGSVGSVQILMKPESTVSDLISSAVTQYIKEGRRPVLPISDPSGFDLHYSQFSLESINREEKLLLLGSRNFFLCKRKDEGFAGVPADTDITPATAYSSSCKEQLDNPARTVFGVPWLKFIGFLQ